MLKRAGTGTTGFTEQQPETATALPRPQSDRENGQVQQSLNGLHPLASGARVTLSKGKATVTNGPFVDTKEVLCGCWMVEAKSNGEPIFNRFLP
jgi:hypothetical protein